MKAQPQIQLLSREDLVMTMYCWFASCPQGFHLLPDVCCPICCLAAAHRQQTSTNSCTLQSLCRSMSLKIILDSSIFPREDFTGLPLANGKWYFRHQQKLLLTVQGTGASWLLLFSGRDQQCKCWHTAGQSLDFYLHHKWKAQPSQCSFGAEREPGFSATAFSYLEG